MVAEAVPGAPYTWARSDLRLAGHLPVTGLAAQLANQFVDLGRISRGPDRLTVGDQAAVGVDRHRTSDLRMSFGEQLLLITVGTEARPRPCG